MGVAALLRVFGLHIDQTRAIESRLPSLERCSKVVKESVLVVCTVGIVACGATKPAAEHAAGRVTPGVFDSAYRAAKAVEAATGQGVTQDQFGPLLQTFATELHIAADQASSVADQRLLDLYAKVLDTYSYSAEVWRAKIRRQTSEAGGDRPVVSIGTTELDLYSGARRFGLRVSDEPTSTGVLLQVLDPDAVQQLWKKASDTQRAATNLYYGR